MTTDGKKGPDQARSEATVNDAKDGDNPSEQETPPALEPGKKSAPPTRARGGDQGSPGAPGSSAHGGADPGRMPEPNGNVPVDRRNHQAESAPDASASATDRSDEPPGPKERRGPQGTGVGKDHTRRGNHPLTSAIPQRLLEEIETHHNLVAAPFLNQSKSPHLEAVAPHPRQQDPDLLSAPPERAAAGSPRQKRGGSARKRSESPDDEEEDSDKEHISSALYYPHQAPSPTTFEDITLSAVGRPQDFRRGGAQLESGPLPPEQCDVETRSDDVDIALRSRTQSRHLRGDLPKTWMSSDEAVDSTPADSGVSSASDSDYDLADEPARPAPDGGGSSHADEGEITPTATPVVPPRFPRSKDRKPRRPSAGPLGAVELKPYNHQVGGHTTVFRFSKRAVCKQLSNRENEFYEAVEHEHPELLEFLPRYGAFSMSLLILSPGSSKLSFNQAVFTHP